jgi:hypothetical protein
MLQEERGQGKQGHEDQIQYLCRFQNLLIRLLGFHCTPQSTAANRLFSPHFKPICALVGRGFSPFQTGFLLLLENIFVIIAEKPQICKSASGGRIREEEAS